MNSKWFGPRALLLHVTLVGWIGGCAAAAYWQITRAVEGNSLSYLYAIEWPVFGIAGIVGWYALINIEKVTEAQEVARREFEERMRAEAQTARAAAAESPELAAYNDHLQQIAQQPKRKLFGH